MQCANCEFENIPGIPRCARCQSLLVLDDVSAVPPRASRFRWKTRWHLFWNERRASWHALRKVLTPRRPTAMRRVSWDLVFWSIVPGLGHIRSQRGTTGKLLLCAWLILLAMALLTVGRGESWLFLSGAIALHTATMLALLRPELVYAGVLRRILLGTTVYIILFCAVYIPVGWFAQRFYVPFTTTGIRSSATIQNGETVLYQGSWLRPHWFHRGDLVMYRLGGGPIAGSGYVLQDGFGLDRIVGLPGDRISLSKGTLLVNDLPPDRPDPVLGKIPNSFESTVTLADDEYFIIPSQLNLVVHGRVPVGRLLGQLSRVRRDNILGRIVWRVQPWSRFGKVF